MGKYNKRCFQQDGYAENVQTCQIFHIHNFIVLSLRFLCGAQNFSATPRILFDSSRRDKDDGIYIIAVNIKNNMLFAVKDCAQKQFLLLGWPLEAKPLTLGQI